MTRPAGPAAPAARDLKLVIIATSLVLMSSVPISTVYADIRAAFAAAPAWALNLMTVAPNVMNMAAVALSGLLLKWVPLKPLSAASLLTILVAGVAPVFGGGLPVVIASRCLVGLGCGVLSPVITILAATSFAGGETQRMMGYRAAAQAIGSMAMMMMTMVLAGMGWRWAFCIYFLVLPPLALTLRLMPARTVAAAAPEGAPPPAEGWPSVGRLAFYAAMALVYMMCLNTLAPSLSSFLVEEGIGAGTLSGLGMSAYMLGSFICGMVYRRAVALVGRFAFFTGLAVTALGIGAIALARGLPLVMAGCLLQGVGFAFFTSSSVLDASAGFTGAARRRAILVVMVATGVGSFTSPFVADFFSGLVYGETLMRHRFTLAVAALAAASLLVLGYDLWRPGRRRAGGTKE